MRRIALLIVVALAAASPGTGNCGPVLNEVMADPATDWNGDGVYDFKNDEWAEIYNPGPTAVDLANYYLGDEVGGFVYGFTGSLPAGGVMVVHGSASVAWESAHAQSTTGLRLGNDGDTITLWQVVGGSNVLVDSYAYTTNEADDDRSSGRSPDGSTTWALFDGLNPYTGSGLPAGNGQPPTPGALNAGGAPPTPVAESTWGRVKELYATP